MKALFRMTFDCNRDGYLDGIFIADTEDVAILKNCDNGIEVCFGEVLGKHSYIYGYIDDNEIEMITQNEEVLEIFSKYSLASGFNPLHQSVTSSTYERYFGSQSGDAYVYEIIEEIKNKRKEILHGN